MKTKAAIIGIFTLGYIAGSAPVFTHSQADEKQFLNLGARTVVSNGSSVTAVRTTATFIPVAAISAHYEPAKPAAKKAAEAPHLDLGKIATRELYLKVSGLPGETVFMTCGVKGTAGDNSRDCGSQQGAITQHAIKTGEQFDNGILLTPDLLPNPTGKSESSVNIEVSYI